MKLAGLALICASVAMTLIFRRHRWLRVLSVLVMLAIAATATMGITASHLLADRMAGVDAQDVAKDMGSDLLAVAVGLAILALAPSKPRQ